MSRSSIFSFETLQRPRVIPRGLLLCLLLLAAIELFVSRSAWVWERFPRSSVGIVYALEARVLADAKPVIVCLGNSRLRDAVAPRALERELGLGHGTVLNLALTDGTPYDSLVLYRRHRPLLRQANVLLLDFEYAYFARRPLLTPRVAHFATLSDRMRLFAEWEERTPALVGYFWRTWGAREYLRRLLTDRHLADEVALAEDGRILWREEGPDGSTPPLDLEADIRTRAEQIAPGVCDRRFLEELARLTDLAREDGVRVVLFHLPLGDRYVEYVRQHYSEQYAQCRAELQRMRVQGNPVVDWEKGSDLGIAEEEFVDYGHLTDAGSEKLTARIADVLRPHLQGDRRTAPQDD